MNKILIEFINTWASCDSYSEFVKKVVKENADKLECKIYYAGKDVSYIRKYGPIMKGTLIINEKKKLDKLSKTIIKNSIEEALHNIWF